MTILRKDLLDMTFAAILILLFISALVVGNPKYTATIVLLPNIIVFLPQFNRTVLKGDIAGLSLGSMLLLGLGTILFTLAGFYSQEFGMMAVNAISLLFVFAICLKLHKKGSLALPFGVLLLTPLSILAVENNIIDANAFLFLGGWVSNIGLIQQAITIHKTKETHGISFKTFMLILFVCGTWLYWGIQLNFWGTMLSNSVGAVCLLYICLYKIKNWRKDHPIAHP